MSRQRSGFKKSRGRDGGECETHFRFGIVQRVRVVNAFLAAGAGMAACCQRGAATYCDQLIGGVAAPLCARRAVGGARTL